MRKKNITFNSVAASLIAFFICTSAATAGDQAKAVLNAIDPKSMNELLEVSRRQPDAALTNIMPVGANKFRFLFVWPASNPVMTYERVGRSFAERFSIFSDQLKLLAMGYCLPSKTMFFGTATYGAEELNVAYRDIEVRYKFGWQPPCPGHYIAASELEQAAKPVRPAIGYGTGAPQPPPATPQGQGPTPDGLTPFLQEPPVPPSQ
jgi:hypothetical protein